MADCQMATSLPPHLMPEPCLGHQKQPAAALDNLRAAQLGQEVLGSFEVLHLNVSRADFPQRVGIGAGARRGAQDVAQVLCQAIDVLLRTAVEDLDDVDQVGDGLDARLTEMAPERVIRMLQIDKSALSLDLQRGFSRRETALYRALQEEADKLARIGHHLLPGHYSFPTTCLQPSRARYGVVVGEKNRGQPEPAAPCGHAFGLPPA